MNIASRIEQQALVRPKQTAITFPVSSSNYNYKYDKLSFAQLNELSSHYAQCLKEKGIKDQDKVLLFVRPSLDFAALTFALFKMGAVPILIDPGMGKKNLLKAIESAAPDALIAVNEVHLIRLLYRQTFSSIKTYITTGFKFLPGLTSVNSWKNKKFKSFKTLEKKQQDMAAILFTSGGTGRPKGVVYTHEIFNTQTDVLQEIFGLSDQDIDLPAFPLFSFFTMSMGMTSCIPDMNPSKPAKCDPKALYQNITDQKASFIAGSPAIWERLAAYCQTNNLTLPSVKHVVMFGAPVRKEVHQSFKDILPNGTTYTPYGATEALPVANIDGRSLLSGLLELGDQGQGTCIGHPTPGLELKIIQATDKVISDISQVKELAHKEVGEIIVKGKVVTPRYLNMSKKTEEAKIADGESFWHRMGDMGSLDSTGKLWFHGRKVHRIELDKQTKYSVSSEAIFNLHPKIKRSALVKLHSKKGPHKAALVVEAKAKTSIDKQTKIELSKLGEKYQHTKDINDFYVCPAFPVDVRHNIKIDRKKLGLLVDQGKLKRL